MLVALPIGMWVFSLACDLIAMRSDSPESWQAAALYSMVGGIIGALLAAVPGLIDLLSLREPAIRKTAVKHKALNLTIVALYAINAWMRVQEAVSPEVALGLSVVAIALLTVSGWLGGKMVYEAGVAVHAEDTAPSAGRWGASRAASERTSGRGARGLGGERAMAADSERPSRDTGDSRRE